MFEHSALKLQDDGKVFTTGGEQVGEIDLSSVRVEGRELKCSFLPYILHQSFSISCRVDETLE
jgi:hypothetical protein